jgi:hypothetical protein
MDGQAERLPDTNYFQIYKQTNRHEQGRAVRHTERDGERKRQKNRQRGKLTDRQTYYRKIDKHRQTDRWTTRQREGQTPITLMVSVFEMDSIERVAFKKLDLSNLKRNSLSS